jgi:hypothetical protein
LNKNEAKWHGSPESVAYRPGKGAYLALIVLAVIVAAFGSTRLWIIPADGTCLCDRCDRGQGRKQKCGENCENDKATRHPDPHFNNSLMMTPGKFGRPTKA